MAKKLSKVSADDLTTEPVSVVTVSYRLDRLDQFSWRPVRLTTYSDATFVEDEPFKADLIDIVTRKLFAFMREAAHLKYTELKALKQQAADNRPLPQGVTPHV